jgi:hypothetical protein
MILYEDESYLNVLVISDEETLTQILNLMSHNLHMSDSQPYSDFVLYLPY